MATTDRSTAYPKMLMRSAIALASVRPQEAINDRIHPPPHGEPRCSKQTNESPIFVLVKKKNTLGGAIKDRTRCCCNQESLSHVPVRWRSAIALSDRPQ